MIGDAVAFFSCVVRDRATYGRELIRIEGMLNRIAGTAFSIFVGITAATPIMAQNSALRIDPKLSREPLPSRAANRPHAGSDSRNTVIWTNDDLERLHGLGLICIVGRINEETPKSPSLPQPYVKTQDPGWYAEQAARLRDELERRQAQLHGYQQGLEDSQSLRETTSAINLDEGDIGITPEAGIEILQERVSETQADLDGLEDLARHDNIPPGTLRGQ
jgi:hypothetical protein